MANYSAEIQAAAVELAEVRAARSRILASGQGNTRGEHSVSEADLRTLNSREDKLVARIARLKRLQRGRGAGRRFVFWGRG